ncbi:MAG: hypothetical protein IKK70_00930 [Clostridia bacterium]|nr:hypothetical protein [Clostridia bacterium]
MKKFLICMLALLMLVPFFAACDGNGDDNSDESLDTGEYVPVTPVKDMGGKTFNVFCHDWSSASILGYTGEIMYDEENPSSVDEAKKRVVDYVETTYNCVIVGEKSNTKLVPDTIKNQVLSGSTEDEYDICFTGISSTAPLAIEGYIEDLKAISTIDLSEPWWDQNAVRDLSIGGKVYFTCGAINTYDDQGTWCMLFNKDLKETLNIEEDFYQLVRDDQWTFDKFVEICRASNATFDSDGDGDQDELDNWAFGTETYNVYVHLVAAGQKIAQKDEEDLPALTLSDETEATYTILGDVLEFYNDQSLVMIANAPPYSTKFPQHPWEETVHRAFIEGGELFYMCGLIHAASFRVMENEFGILPIPKYYDTQENYYHTVSQGNASCMCIPVGLEDTEDVGLIVSAIAEMSLQEVTPAYYDVQLKYRDSHDDESGEMLDIIFASRSFDLGAAFNWGGMLEAYTSLDVNVSSRFEAKISAAETAMNQTISNIVD